MSTNGLADRNRDLGHGCGTQDEDDTQRLIGILRELLAGLDRPAVGAAGLESDIEDVERWDGDEYLYLEAAVPSANPAEIDVSIHGGRAFIRIARS